MAGAGGQTAGRGPLPAKGLSSAQTAHPHRMHMVPMCSPGHVPLPDTPRHADAHVDTTTCRVPACVPMTTHTRGCTHAHIMHVWIPMPGVYIHGHVCMCRPVLRCPRMHKPTFRKTHVLMHLNTHTCACMTQHAHHTCTEQLCMWPHTFFHMLTPAHSRTHPAVWPTALTLSVPDAASTSARHHKSLPAPGLQAGGGERRGSDASLVSEEQQPELLFPLWVGPRGPLWCRERPCFLGRRHPSPLLQPPEGLCQLRALLEKGGYGRGGRSLRREKPGRRLVPGHARVAGSTRAEGAERRCPRLLSPLG